MIRGSQGFKECLGGGGIADTARMPIDNAVYSVIDARLNDGVNVTHRDGGQIWQSNSGAMPGRRDKAVDGSVIVKNISARISPWVHRHSMQLNVLAIFINKMTAFSAELAVHSRKGLPETQGNKG
jgi:hypothetical protein